MNIDAMNIDAMNIDAMNIDAMNIPSVNIGSVYNIFDQALATYPSITPLDTPKNLEDVLTDENLTILDYFRGQIFSLDDFLTLFYSGNKEYFGFSRSNRSHPVFNLANHTHTPLERSTRTFSLYSEVLNGYSTKKGLFNTNLKPTKLMQLRKEVMQLQKLGQFSGHTFASSWSEVEQMLLLQSQFQTLLLAQTLPTYIICEMHMHVLFRCITLSGYTHTMRFRFLVNIPVARILARQGVIWSSVSSGNVDSSNVLVNENITMNVGSTGAVGVNNAFLNHGNNNEGNVLGGVGKSSGKYCHHCSAEMKGHESAKCCHRCCVEMKGRESAKCCHRCKNVACCCAEMKGHENEMTMICYRCRDMECCCVEMELTENEMTMICYRCKCMDCCCVEMEMIKNEMTMICYRCRGMECGKCVNKILHLESINEIGKYMEKFLKGEIRNETYSVDTVAALSAQIIDFQKLCPNSECITLLLQLYLKIVVLIQRGAFTETELENVKIKLAAAENDSKILHDPFLLKQYMDEMSKGINAISLKMSFTAPLLEIKPMYLKYILKYGLPENLVFDAYLLRECES